MKILIKNGHVLDPLTGKDGTYDVLIQDDRIAAVEMKIEDAADDVIDASGCYVMPGLIDLHVHLRDPGLTRKETLATGGAAAARGGITTICAMPNTMPVIDTKEKVEEVHRRAKEESPVHVIQIGAITMGQEGKELADIKGMAEAGCHAISEDGKSVMDEKLYREAMIAAKEAGVSVFAHCEDKNLVQGGVINAGAKANELGLAGITNAVEDDIAYRDMCMAVPIGVHLHLCHCSTKESVRLVREAKFEHIPVTGEVCPHHFTLTDMDIPSDDGNYKMNPPLRSEEDKEALRRGLADNIMDVISTDHAPHMESEKNCSFKQAAFGIVGLETSLALTYTELVDTGLLTPMQMAEKMSSNPARILGLTEKGAVAPGKIADLTIFDPAKEYAIDVRAFVSKGKNSPFHGRRVKGEVQYTIVDGKIVYTARHNR